MKAYIIKERCAADPRICPPMQTCAMKAFLYTQDDAEPLGGRMEIDAGQCSGCGQCVAACCGNCIEMR